MAKIRCGDCGEWRTDDAGRCEWCGEARSIDWGWVGETVAVAGMVLLWILAIPYGWMRQEERRARERAIAVEQTYREQLLDYPKRMEVDPPEPVERVRVNVGGVIVTGKRLR